MFSHQQITHFRTFGFVVLHGLLDGGEAARLRAEVTANLCEAFGGIGTDGDPDGTGGIRGDYLPLSVDRAPLSQSLIADDPRLFQGSAELLGGLTVPSMPVATCFTTNAGWHNDHGSEVDGLKFIAYLEPRRAATGALRVIPGSHLPEFRARLAGYWSQDPACSGFDGWPVPDVVLETDPGDVIAVDAHLFHASAGGEKRLAWTIEYLPWPGLGDPDRTAATRRLILATVDSERDGWPAWQEWVAGARGGVPSRQVAVQRLRLLGTLGE